MPNLAEDRALLYSLLSQKLNDSGNLEDIDWSKVCEALNIDKVDTVKKRWSRLKIDITKNGFRLSEGGNDKPEKTPTTPKKTANPKARAAVEKKVAKPRARKPKAAAAVEEVDEDMEVEDVKKEEANLDYEQAEEEEN